MNIHLFRMGEFASVSDVVLGAAALVRNALPGIHQNPENALLPEGLGCTSEQFLDAFTDTGSTFSFQE